MSGAARVAIVTGAANGIGRAIALALADAGYLVASADRDAIALAALCDGRPALLPIVQDVTEVDALAPLVDGIAARLGAPWLLVNNAARGGGGAIGTVSPETFDAVFAVSARAAFFLTQAVVPHMAEAGGGRIVNVASLIAAKGAPANSHYAGAKAAMIGFTRAWAQEFADRQIAVNAILPALTDTPMTRGAMHPDAIAAKAATVPMGRLATPGDCAALTLFLASPEAEFLTGQVMSPNGGEFVGAL